MQKNISFNQRTAFKVKDEYTKGILLTFNPLNSDGNAVTLNDFNKVSLTVRLLNEKTKSKITIWNDNLGTLINTIYAQDPRFDLQFEKVNNSYKVYLPFSVQGFNGVAQLKNHVVLDVVINAQPTAFASTMVLPSSSIVFETVPTTLRTNLNTFPVIDTTPIEADSKDVNLNLGSSVVQAVLLIDEKQAYKDTSNSKPSSFRLKGYTSTGEQYNKDVTESLALHQNREMLAFNPETDIRNLIIYKGERLSNVVTDIDFENPSTQFTKVATIKLQSKPD